MIRTLLATTAVLALSAAGASAEDDVAAELALGYAIVQGKDPSTLAASARGRVRGAGVWDPMCEVRAYGALR